VPDSAPPPSIPPHSSVASAPDPAASTALPSATAAVQRPLTAAELRHWAEQYARTDTELADTGAGTAHVIFRVGGERFAVPLADLDEVAQVEVGIGLDHASPLVLGLVNIRGEIVPMLDTAAALGTRASQRLGPQNRSLVVRDARDRRTALPVDQVESIELLASALFQAQAGGDDGEAPIRRIGIGEHAGGSLTLLDVGGLRRTGADAGF
jgi:chemotaxis signal transduction protein